MEHQHPTTGNVFIMAGGPISRLSQKQSTVALSTAEAEYIALSSAAQEIVWLKKLNSKYLRLGNQLYTIYFPSECFLLIILLNRDIMFSFY